MRIDIPTLVDAAGGEIVGKVRLQKIVYLLDQVGFSSELSFVYHNYGPYSEELADRVEDDLAFGRLEAETRRRKSDGVPFVVYNVSTGERDDATRSALTTEIKAALYSMQRVPAVVLELAATIHWLTEVEGIQDWHGELAVRKGSKTAGGRVDAALNLLKEIHLAPAAVRT